MTGNLEPEEDIMSDFRRDFILLYMMDQINSVMQKLNWDNEDNIVIEIGGTSVSGIDVGEVYNKKWQSPKGTVKYNKDAFIVIKNLSRTPFQPSSANPDLKQQHEFTGGK